LKRSNRGVFKVHPGIREVPRLTCHDGKSWIIGRAFFFFL